VNNNSKRPKNFKDILQEKADRLAHLVYKISKDFPSEDKFGITSQIRRASFSVILNLVEGYARKGTKEYMQFLRISYGSLQETKYLLHFCLEEKMLTSVNFQASIALADEIGAMLWKTMQTLGEK